MTTIGLCHCQVGGTDGVSLEMDKWKIALERLGHTVHLCGGDLGTTEGFLIEELYHHRENIERIHRNAFDRLTDYESEAALERDIFEMADRIEQDLYSFIDEFSLDLLIPNNIWSIGVNLPAAIAFARVVRKRKIPAVAHHHDFHWETFRGMTPTCAVVRRITREYLPPKDPLVTHVVINSLVRAELRQRGESESTIIPNVFDFAGEPWCIDEYNRDFREAIGVNDNDIIVLQATRIVERKGIELAIDFVEEINKPSNIAKLQEDRLYDGRSFTKDNRVVLVLAGYSEDKTENYLSRLKRKIERAGIEARFIAEKVRSRREESDGERLYSLWDCYALADLVTYPSLFEGWGNQFLEAIRAKLPVAIFEYPVYRADIREKGFDVISLGNEIEGTDESGLVYLSKAMVRSATEKAVEVLTDSSARQTMVDRNFDLGREYYSLESLEERLD
ncbi:MAG: glycosyltransferase family 4 protein, partial [Candidatus Bipolaricaulota bacterium]|nr:glycosyltransferase family 4 protein [Candidatus Bipolaricaulota bacterium]